MQGVFYCGMITPMVEMLNIVNEQDEIVGTEDRIKIHKEGLLHREIHVWVYNDAGDILFQHRAKDKDTRPDKLDASVGGHVDLGQSYAGAALRELEEETGIVAKQEDLIFIKMIRKRTMDNTTNTINNAFSAQYKYRYKGEELQVEEGKAYGFEWWGLGALKSLSEVDRTRFSPTMIDDEHMEFFEEIKSSI